MSTSTWTPGAHHIVEKRWSKHRRPRWEDHCKTIQLFPTKIAAILMFLTLNVVLFTNARALLCMKEWCFLNAWVIARSSHYHHCLLTDRLVCLIIHIEQLPNPKKPFWWEQPLMTMGDRIGLGPSVSSSALIWDGSQMKSNSRSLGKEGEMSWQESKRRKLHSAAAAGAAESKQLYLIYNQTANYSALIKTVVCSVSQLCNS